MKRNFTLLTFIIFLIVTEKINAQNTFPASGAAGIGTTSPNSSSLLEIKSTTKGLLIPRMTQAQRNAIASPATSLLIYQTDANAGYYYYTGSSWSNIAFWKKSGSNIYFNTGNLGIGTATPAYKLDVVGDINLATGNYLRTNGVRILRDNPNSGDNNVFLGDYADTVSSPGFRNVAIGSYAMAANIGAYNTAVGSTSMMNNTTGSSNAAFGEKTLQANTTGSYDVAVGSGALQNNTTAQDNIGIGFQTLYSTTTGADNIALGYHSLYTNSTGENNIGIGSITMYSNTTGSGNTAMGEDALYSNLIQNDNSAFGFDALNYSTGGQNTAVGSKSLFYNSTAFYNTAVGWQAAYNLTTGSGNTAVGYNSGFSSAGVQNSTAIGGAAVAASNQVMIGNSQVTSIGGIVGWTNFSDGRYKQNIQQNVPGLAFINKLQPITYTLNLKGINDKIQADQNVTAKLKEESSNVAYNDMMSKAAIENSKIIYSGFIAQDVEKAAQSLNYTFNGVDKPKDADKDFYGLRYADFVVPLVKAVQELSKLNDEKDSAMQQQDIKIDNLQNEINELKAMIGNQSSANVQLSSASLQQNIPNPYNQSTMIKYKLPQKFSSAQIIITDNSGKTIQQVPLSNAQQNSINIKAGTLANGSYNYSLIVDGKLIDTKQMILSK